MVIMVRSRHFAIEWFKVKSLLDSGEMTVQWISTDQNVADFFTKKLGREKFMFFRDIRMGDEKLQDYFLPLIAARASQLHDKIRENMCVFIQAKSRPKNRSMKRALCCR